MWRPSGLASSEGLPSCGGGRDGVGKVSVRVAGAVGPLHGRLPHLVFLFVCLFYQKLIKP